MSTAAEGRLPLLGALLLGIFLARASAISVSSLELGFDEAQYWAWSQHLAFGYFNKPPLIAWLIRSATIFCGDGQACVRLPANVLQTASAFLVYALGARLYDARVGFWSALAYALMPGVAVSSFLITTDVPLLFFWTIALLAFAAHLERPRVATGVLMGLALGLGLNAKYAMVYFPLCATLYVALTPSVRRIAREATTWLGLGLGIALILPNIVWNFLNGNVTFHHTSDNIGGGHGFSLHPAHALDFIGSQFGVGGPLLFGGFLVVAFSRMRSGKPATDRMLLFFSLPIFILLTLEGLRAHANGNWAATAFPAAVVLVTAVVISRRQWRTLGATVAINAAAALVIAVGAAIATPQGVPHFLKPVRQLFGWRDMADQIERLAAPTGLHMIVADDRITAAELTYTLRDKGYRVHEIADADSPPADHFQMTRPWFSESPGPVLFLTDDPLENYGIEPRRATDLGAVQPSEGFLEDDANHLWRIGAPGR